MKRVRGVAATAALVGAVLGLGGCGVVPTTPAETSISSSTTTTEAAMQRVQLAANACMVGHITQDEGTSITLDTDGSEDGAGEFSETVEDVGCVLGELEAPDYVTQHISTTRALDGQQSDEWDDIEARWTYHPDNGLQITFIDRA